jgi:quercetin dioxygenase-like cupin family protein
MKSITFAGIALLSSLCLFQTAQAQPAEQRPTRVVLQKTDVGNTGREATLQTVEFVKGAAEIPHTHPGELMGYVLTGAFELNVAGRPMVTYRAGEGFMVEGGKVHYGKNIADGPSKLLVTIILEKGKDPSSPAPAK